MVITKARKRSRQSRASRPLHTVLDAAEKVLRRHRKPMTGREIASEIIEKGLWSTPGKTPEATVAARIYVDVKDWGRRSRFRLAGPGRFAIRKPR